MDKIEKRTIPFEVRVEDREDGPPKIVGHAAMFNQETVIGGVFREMIAEGAFKNTLEAKADVRGLWNHDVNFVLGRTKSGTLKLREDSKGLLSEIDPPNTQLINDLVLEPMRRGDVDQMSFGFKVKGQEWRDGENGELDLRIITDAELFDISPVTFPAYSGTDVGLRAHSEYRKNKDADKKRLDIKKRKLRLSEER